MNKVKTINNTNNIEEEAKKLKELAWDNFLYEVLKYQDFQIEDYLDGEDLEQWCKIIDEKTKTLDEDDLYDWVSSL